MAHQQTSAAHLCVFQGQAKAKTIKDRSSSFRTLIILHYFRNFYTVVVFLEILQYWYGPS